MEILIYDAEFNLKKIVENGVSILWKRRYNDVGEFQITCPATMANVEAFAMDRVVWIRGKKEAGVIESRSMRQDHSQNTLTVKGRFLESYMDRRLIRPTLNFEGTVEDAMRKILTDAVPLPMVQLEERHGWTDEVSFQATYKNLLDYEKKLAKSANYGFRFVPDFLNKTITFEIYQGLDHSANQRDRSKVIFSEEYGNMTSSDYNENGQLYKTVCYVGGEGEWRDKFVIVSGDDSLTGLERRETFHDGSDLTSNGLTIAQYKETLRQRGNEVLEGCVLADAFSCEVNPNGNFKYGSSYDVGDIVTVQKESWNLSEDKRITEITEIYEHGLPTIEPVFGTILPETINWED
jgi:hypothetical protein